MDMMRLADIAAICLTGLGGTINCRRCVSGCNVLSMTNVSAAAAAIYGWYVNHYWTTDNDVGTLTFLTRVDKLGYFAIDKDAIEAADEDALFKLLVLTTMFQRLRDQNVCSILRSLSNEQVNSVTRPQLLDLSIRNAECEFCRNNEVLKGQCTVTKLGNSKPFCDQINVVGCHIREHSHILRRYGHFGKIPSSIYHVMSSNGGIKSLIHTAIKSSSNRVSRTKYLIESLTDVWRIGPKLASMFVSLLVTENLCKVRAPFVSEFDSSYALVIDINTMSAIERLGYTGSRSYEAQSEFIRVLAVSLTAHSDNFGTAKLEVSPRLLQQALYMFMSKPNRQTVISDCSHKCTDCDYCIDAKICPFFTGLTPNLTN